VTSTLADTKPLRLSWTRIRTHEECPAKGDLKARGFKSPVMDVTAFFKGNVTDQLMRRWLSMENPAGEMGWMAAQVNAVFDELEANPEGVLRWKTRTHRAETLEFCRELVVRLEEILAVYCLPFDWTPAWRFTVPVSVPYGQCMRTVELIGETDLLVFDRLGRVIVLDLKATADDSYWRKTLAQLAFYALAVKASRASRLGRWPVRAGLIQPMCKEPVLMVDVMKDGGQAVREMSGRIQRTARDIWEGRVEPKRNDWCGTCEVRHACPLWAAPSGGQVLLTA
jgi:hypothetical protein